jgi:hypothetical protein
MSLRPLTIEGISPHEEIRLCTSSRSTTAEPVALVEIDNPYGSVKGHADVELTREKAERLIAWLGRFLAGPEGM